MSTWWERWGTPVLVMVVIANIGSMALHLTACRTQGAVEAPSRAISCSTEAVRRDWPTAYPDVMRCLTGLIEGPMACLDSVAPALRVGIDVVACIVHATGREAAYRAGENATDVVSLRKAERASAWIESRRFIFEGE